MKDPVQIRLSGSGGQGLITAGVILAEAALLDGRNVVQTQTYGPEARLGSSRSEVVISKERIAYPQVSVPDVLVCLSLEAASKFAQQVHDRTVVILDSGLASTPPARGIVHRLPITEIAIAAGSKVAANTVALWSMNRLAGLVSAESLKRAIIARVPARFRALNERAMEAAEQMVSATASAGGSRSVNAGLS